MNEKDLYAFQFIIDALERFYLTNKPCSEGLCLVLRGLEGLYKKENQKCLKKRKQKRMDRQPPRVSPMDRPFESHLTLPALKKAVLHTPIDQLLALLEALMLVDRALGLTAHQSVVKTLIKERTSAYDDSPTHKSLGGSLR